MNGIPQDWLDRLAMRDSRKGRRAGRFFDRMLIQKWACDSSLIRTKQTMMNITNTIRVLTFITNRRSRRKALGSPLLRPDQRLERRRLSREKRRSVHQTLINYEYAIVSSRQADAATAAAIRKFLLWCIVPSETDESYLDSVHFIALPPHVWELSQARFKRYDAR